MMGNCKNSKNSVDVTTVKDFDLSRYLGRWHEIARFDNWFERGQREVEAEYTMRDDGMLKVVNSSYDVRKGKRRFTDGRAKVTSTPGLLRVSFFLWFYSDYRVLAVSDDYEWAIVGTDEAGRYLWILARKPMMDEETLSIVLAEARRRGYDVNRLLYNTQRV